MPDEVHNKFLPILLVFIAAFAALSAAAMFKRPLNYPYIEVSAPGGVDIALLFTGRKGLATCQELTARVADNVLAVCPTCVARKKECLDSLTREQKRTLSNAPLEIPSARMPDGGVITYKAPVQDMALAVCLESERKAASNTPVSRVTCHAPQTMRPVSFLQQEFLGSPARVMGVLLAAVGVFALTAAAYLLSRRDDLRLYLSRLPRGSKRMIMLGFDIVLIPAALASTLLIRYGGFWWETEGLGLTFALALLIAVPVFARMGLYRAFIRYLEFRTVLIVAGGVSLSALLLASALSLLSINSLTNEDIVLYWHLAMLYIGGNRIVAREYFRQAGVRSNAQDRAIIYGAGEAGAHLAASLKGKSGLTPVAFVDDNDDLLGSLLYGLKVHSASRLPELVGELNARQVLLAIPSASRQKRREIYDKLESLEVRIRTIPRLSALISGRAQISDIEDVSIEELIGRDPVPPIATLLSQCTKGKVVAVTGAGGSIGSELCRQIASLHPRKLILVDVSEFALYAVHEELSALQRSMHAFVEIVPILSSVTTRDGLRRIFAEHGVNTVYHAAAYKHVPLVESNPLEGIRNNVIGTLRAAEAAIATNVETFVLISTDKAVRPTSIMGASKRVAELIAQTIGVGTDTRFCMVRFGNVLNSSGSVVPLFRKQIQDGGPVCVTHPDISRYFMTIPEAAQLVLQASAMAKGGDVFVLDMGQPVKIVDLARRMIRLSGSKFRDESHPDGNIEIRFTGLRPGEKLYEELLIKDNVLATAHPLIMRAMEESIPWARLRTSLNALEEACNRLDAKGALSLLSSVVPLTAQPESASPEATTTAIRPPPLKLVN